MCHITISSIKKHTVYVIRATERRKIAIDGFWTQSDAIVASVLAAVFSFGDKIDVICSYDTLVELLLLHRVSLVPISAGCQGVAEKV